MSTKWYQYAAEASLGNLIVFIYVWKSLDGVFDSLVGLPVETLGAVVSASALIGAGALAGSFNLTYEKTRMTRTFDRVLAHFTKYALYAVIGLAFEIAIVAISVAEGGSRAGGQLFTVALLLFLSLLLFNYWDLLKTASALSAKSNEG